MEVASIINVFRFLKSNGLMCLREFFKKCYRENIKTSLFFQMILIIIVVFFHYQSESYLKFHKRMLSIELDSVDHKIEESRLDLKSKINYLESQLSDVSDKIDKIKYLMINNQKLISDIKSQKNAGDSNLVNKKENITKITMIDLATAVASVRVGFYDESYDISANYSLILEKLLKLNDPYINEAVAGMRSEVQNNVMNFNQLNIEAIRCFDSVGSYDFNFSGIKILSVKENPYTDYAKQQGDIMRRLESISEDNSLVGGCFSDVQNKIKDTFLVRQRFNDIYNRIVELMKTTF